MGDRIDDHGMVHSCERFEPRDFSEPGDDPFLRELMEAMLRPIGATCRVCRCVERDHSEILIGRPCLNFDCIHVCFGFEPVSDSAANVIPLILSTA